MTGPPYCPVMLPKTRYVSIISKILPISTLPGKFFRDYLYRITGVPVSAYSKMVWATAGGRFTQP